MAKCTDECPICGGVCTAKDANHIEKKIKHICPNLHQWRMW